MAFLYIPATYRFLNGFSGSSFGEASSWLWSW
jgi:hypothetical protein